MILTHGQVLYLGSLVNMTQLHERLIEQGTTLTNHWATVTQCYPSRASQLRGQAAHNTIVKNVGLPRWMMRFFGSKALLFLCSVDDLGPGYGLLVE
jgi:arylsulfatase A-like enzyme